MSKSGALLRKAHFLGGKVRGLRKHNGMTLDDLSLRCMQIDRKRAPSVSYLSMIETGKRVPSEQLLALLAEVFQKDVGWFLDEQRQEDTEIPSASPGAIAGLPLKPGFLFSKDMLETAIPELLAQTGTSGRQFAQLLIRSYQETNQNRFPDLERAAEEIGGKRFPLAIDDLLKLCKQQGLKLKWFDRKSMTVADDSGIEIKTMLRSFYDAPDTVWLNRRLEDQPGRLMYDLASHIGHKVLHGGDGQRSCHAAGSQTGGWAGSNGNLQPIDSNDILHAWRDFEASFFAGALLCPSLPFRQFLIRHAHSITAGKQLSLTPSVVMRRMTAVSPYRHWHYFDAYPPGHLKAVYRANGIPLPWGNMRMVVDPCQQWAVFRMLSHTGKKPHAQISVLQREDEARLYCCQSIRTRDAAGNRHVVCVGIDLSPALMSQGLDAAAIVDDIKESCRRGGGSAEIKGDSRDQIERTARVINIGWIEDGLKQPANIICPRSSACPRPTACVKLPRTRPRPWFEQIREEIINEPVR